MAPAWWPLCRWRGICVWSRWGRRPHLAPSSAFPLALTLVLVLLAPLLVPLPAQALA